MGLRAAAVTSGNLHSLFFFYILFLLLKLELCLSDSSKPKG